jgi:hypothetical protein
MKTREKYYVGKYSGKDVLTPIDEVGKDRKYKPVGWDPTKFR